MSKDKKSNALQAEVFRLGVGFFSSLKVWIGLKKRLPRHKLAATNCGIFLNLHSRREMKDISLKSWRCKWKNISVDLLPQIVEEWILMTPTRLKEWGRVRL